MAAGSSAFVSVDELVLNLNSLSPSSFANEADRLKCRKALQAALRRVQSPWETMLGHVWTEPTTTAVVKTLIDAGFWKKWVGSGNQPGSVEALAEIGGIDAELLRRLLRQLASEGFVQEVGVDTFGPTPYTAALAEDQFPHVYTTFFEMTQPGFTHLPKFLSKVGYQNPSDPAKTCWKDFLGLPSDADPWAGLAAQPKLAAAYNDSMAVYSAGRVWTDIYPTETIVAAGKDYPDRTLVVDVGGGIGHNLQAFVSKHKDIAPGSLVLQDLPHVVDNTPVKAPITTMVHNIFHQQPVEAARAYTLNIVLHNWSDGEVVAILKNIVVAMERGYSRVLVYEIVLPHDKALPRAAMSDLLMMVYFSGKERSEGAWRGLVLQAGLQITKIWSSPTVAESVIELELV